MKELLLNRWKLLMLRKENKLTQEEMAKSLGITSVSYRSKENGKKQFTENEIVKILNMFKKEANYFFSK